MEAILEMYQHVAHLKILLIILAFKIYNDFKGSHLKFCAQQMCLAALLRLLVYILNIRRTFLLEICIKIYFQEHVLFQRS